jgi:Mg2+-importing ATPase
MPLLTVATDNVDVDIVKTSTRWNIRHVLRFMTVFGLVSTIFDILAFATLRYSFDVNERTFQTAWFLFSLLTELLVVIVLRTRRSVFRSRPGNLLATATAAAALAALAIPYIKPLAPIFAFSALSLPVVTAIMGLVFGYLAANEIAKRFAWS